MQFKLAISFLIIMLSSTTMIAKADDLEIDSIETTTFLSPARLPQSKHSTPSGLTVITAADIKNLGISKIPELMRLVPGMRMTQANGWDYRISYHGTSAFRPRRMSVLVNGNPVFRSAFQQVDWTRFPLSISDIARVEIVRSPSGASYGSNSFQAVVNIITNHPSDAPTITASAEAGSNGFQNTYLQLATMTDNNSYLLSFTDTRDEGFDLIRYDLRKGFQRGGNDDFEGQKINIRTEHRLSDNLRAQLSGGYSTSDLNHIQIESQQTGYDDTNQKDSHINGELFYNADEKNASNLKFQLNRTNYLQSWPTCFYTAYFVPGLRDLYNANPKLALDLFAGKVPTGSTDQERALINAALQQAASVGSNIRKNICGTGNQDALEVRQNIEFSHTYIASESFKINGGLGYWYNEGESETFYGGKTDSNYQYAFTNAEYSPNNLVTLNLGGMYEKVSTVNDSAFSPRVAANFHVTDSTTLRAVYSTGHRMPSLDETNRQWSYYMRDWDKTVFGKNEGWMFLTARSNPNLKPEQIEAYEIGLYSEQLGGVLSYDLKVFKEELSDLISEKILYFDYNLTNNNSAELAGFEGEISYKISSQLQIRTGFSYLDSEVTDPSEETLFSKYAGFASAIYKLDNLVVGLTYYSNSQMANESFDRLDLSLSGTIKVGIPETISWRFVLTDNHYDYIGYERTPGSVSLNGYDEDYQVKFGLSLQY